MPGATHSRAIFAALSTPQRTRPSAILPSRRSVRGGA
jgi:hypothetical protein